MTFPHRRVLRVAISVKVSRRLRRTVVPSTLSSRRTRREPMRSSMSFWSSVLGMISHAVILLKQSRLKSLAPSCCVKQRMHTSAYFRELILMSTGMELSKKHPRIVPLIIQNFFWIKSANASLFLLLAVLTLFKKKKWCNKCLFICLFVFTCKKGLFA